MVECAFSFDANFGERVDCVDGELSLGSFVEEHDAIYSVDNALTHVCSFASTWLGHAYHRIEDM